jgi:hypothetical protein
MEDYNHFVNKQKNKEQEKKFKYKWDFSRVFMNSWLRKVNSNAD